MKLSIEISQEGLPVRGMPVEDRVYLVGSLPQCDIVMPPGDARPRHLSIEGNGEKAVFTRLASGGAIALNGKPARSGVAGVGDTISLGRSRLFFFDSENPHHRSVEQIRALVHEVLVERLDLRKLNIDELDDDGLWRRCEGIARDILAGSYLPPGVDQEKLLVEVLREALRLGPLEELLDDPTISEVMVNGRDNIFIERAGKLVRVPVSFTSDAHVAHIIGRIVHPVGRRIDESSPMVDARLAAGSRVNAIIPPLALRGPSITIRKFMQKKLDVSDLLRFGAMNREMGEFLREAVERKKNIIISGGTGSGKTTLLNVLANFIPQSERVVTVEDSAELKLPQENLVALEARAANVEGKGAVPIRDLVKNALRMRPDRIVVGECRGGESLDMLQAMNTGHDGSLTTLHANSPQDAILRLETMVMMAGFDLPGSAIRMQIASAVDIIVQQARLSDGSRRVTEISEVAGIEGGEVKMLPVFRFRKTGVDAEFRILGSYEATGHIPAFVAEAALMGNPLDSAIFAVQGEGGGAA